MGIDIPGWAADLVNDIGYLWPKTDETRLLELARSWLDFSSTVGALVAAADRPGTAVVQANQGADVDAFARKWSAPASGPNVLAEGERGAQVIAGCLVVCAGVVLALKVNVMIQLAVLLAEIEAAITLAPVTAGASLLEIPLAQKGASLAVNLLISEAMRVISG